MKTTLLVLATTLSLAPASPLFAQDGAVGGEQPAAKKAPAQFGCSELAGQLAEASLAQSGHRLGTETGAADLRARKSLAIDEHDLVTAQGERARREAAGHTGSDDENHRSHEIRKRCGHCRSMRAPSIPARASRACASRIENALRTDCGASLRTTGERVMHREPQRASR